MSRSRYNARYDVAEDRDILKWYNDGKSIYSIAKELNRSPNAITRRLDEILLPLQNAIPISKKIQEKPTLSILTDQEYVTSLFQSGMDWHKAYMYAVAHPYVAPPLTPKKLGFVESVFGFLIPK